MSTVQNRRHDIAIVFISSFFFLSSPMLVTPIIAGYSESLRASAAMMGVIGGLMNICALFCRPFFGNLADQVSKYKLSFIGAALMAVSCVGYIVAWNPAFLIVSRIVNGVGCACCSVCMTTWMSNLLPQDKIGSGIGIYGTMNALAMAIAPAIGLSMYEKLGYKAAFAVAAIFSALTVLMIQFVHDKGEPVSSREVNAGERRKLEIADKKVIPVAAIIMLFTIPYCATQSFLVSYVAAKHLNVTVTLFFPLYAVMLFVLRISLRNLFDRKPFSFFMILSSVSAAISILALTVMKNNYLIIFAALFMAGGYGIMCSVCQSKAILLADKEKRGLATSTYYIGFDLGMSLGPIIGGILYGHVDINYFYPCLAITVPLGIVVFLLNKNKLCRRC